MKLDNRVRDIPLATVLVAGITAVLPLILMALNCGTMWFTTTPIGAVSFDMDFGTFLIKTVSWLMLWPIALIIGTVMLVQPRRL